jgi:chemotaxis protein methyltransferase CheR
MAFTFFWRDEHVLARVVQFVAPILGGRNRPRIWDAGCAMGQEPYTLCMMLADSLGRFAFNNLTIHATDMDDQDTFGPIVTAGVYAKGELERMPAAAVEAYFEPAETAGHLRVVERIRSRLQFQKHNLLSCREIGQSFSLVLCKNVLLHFQAAERVEVLRMFHRALVPGGLLATEQTQKMPAEVAPLFEQLVPDAQLFRKVESLPCE